MAHVVQKEKTSLFRSYGTATTHMTAILFSLQTLFGYDLMEYVEQ